jgi:hypothetical protein
MMATTVTNPRLSVALKRAGAPQVGDSEWLVGPEDAPDEDKEAVKAFGTEYLMRVLPMTIELADRHRMALDFCRYVVDGAHVFCASYRPVGAPLADRRSIIPAAMQAETFVDSLGHLYLWLLTKTTVFHAARKVESAKPEAAEKAAAEGAEAREAETSTPPEGESREEASGETLPPDEHGGAAETEGSDSHDK